MRKKVERHGYNRTPELTAYYNMIRRCDPKATNQGYKKYYSEKGITVCDLFKASFLAFLDEVGPRPGPGYSIDRIDNERGYEPGNIQWTTKKVQQRNRSDFNKKVIFNGEEMLLCELAERCGVDQKLLRMRLFVYGWRIERAIQKINFKKLPRKDRYKPIY